MSALDEHGSTALHKAAYGGQVPAIEAIIQENAQMIDVHDSFGRTPLALAAQAGYSEAIETLVRLGSQALDTPTSSGTTPMHSAAFAESFAELFKAEEEQARQAEEQARRAEEKKRRTQDLFEQLAELKREAGAIIDDFPQDPQMAKDIQSAFSQTDESRLIQELRLQKLEFEEFEQNLTRLIDKYSPKFSSFVDGEPFLKNHGLNSSWETFATDELENSLSMGLISQLPTETDPAGFTKDYLFNEIQHFPASALVDVSGSGKTRHIFEMLSIRFGFYFVGDPGRNGGSSDLKAISEVIHQCLEKNVEPSERFSNFVFAQHYICLLIYARLKVFSTIQRLFGAKPFPAKLWLLIQAYPTALLGEDLFREIANLVSLTRVFDRVMMTNTLRKLFSSTFGEDQVPFVLDEAQSLPESELFTSQWTSAQFDPPEEAVSRGRCILSAFCSAVLQIAATPMSLPLVLSGTHIRIQRIEEVNTSYLSVVNMDKPDLLNIVSNLNGFRTRDQIATAVERFGFARPSDAEFNDKDQCAIIQRNQEMNNEQ